ncbi:MAG: phage portal protein [Romboutsia timonensis]
MAKKRSMMVNNNLGGNQIVYIDGEKEKKDTIETYNVSANQIEVDKLVAKVYDEFNSSNERKLMLEGIKYYDNDSKIDEKIRFDHCGTDGKVNDKLSNAKMHKNIMRKLTRQKVNTLLGKPYSIKTDDETYKKILEDDYFTKYMYRKVYNTCKEAIKEGIHWLNAYYDENGELQFRRVPGNQVKVFWADREHTKIAQLIHYYEISVYKGDTNQNVTYADYYSPNGVIHYIKEEKGFVRDKERPAEEGNFTLMVPQTEDIKNDKGEIIEKTYKLDENGRIVFEPQQMVWERIPWIPLKYNEEETSLLKYIKSHQDSYESLISAMVDIVIDIPNAIKYFKGYSGADLQELTEKIAQFRAVLIDPDGDVGSLDTEFDGTTFGELLDRIRKDAYEDGGGVDMQSDKTGDKSGVGLKFLYSDLDLDLGELEQEMDVFFEWLLWFIDFDIRMKHGSDYSEVEVTFDFNKTNIVNESELISMINSSRDMIPDEILLPKHPFVEDVTEVEDAIERQRAAEDEEMERQMKLYGNQGFGNNQQTGSKLPKVTSSSSSNKTNKSSNKSEKKSQVSTSNTNS